MNHTVPDPGTFFLPFRPRRGRGPCPGPGFPFPGRRPYNGRMAFDPPALYQTLDEAMMARCLMLAEKGLGTASPNPMVGAVVLDAQGRKVGEGYHVRAGEAHAEVFALDQAGEQARGGTLYVNLEPCNHHGRTPPCTERVIAAGVSRVVCGTLDPNPIVSGSGRDALQNARIEVRHGFLEAECRRLNEVFFHYITAKMPFVTLKLAMTTDGKLATRHGESRWITGPFARQMVHHMRHRHDAVLTTAETVLADDPLLTVRDIPGIRMQPVRIVLDRRLRVNADRQKLFKSLFEKADQPVWIVTSRTGHDAANARKAKQAGARLIEVDETPDGLDLRQALSALAEERVASVMVEAGGRLAGSLLNAGLVQKLCLFYAPKILTDRMAQPAFGAGFQMHLPQAAQFQVDRVQALDGDWLVEAYPLKKPLPALRQP